MAIVKNVVLVVALASVAGTTGASGLRSPAHAQLTYSFSCPSGASGHLSYARNAPPHEQTHFTLWVNGSYLHNDPKVASLLSGKNLESVAASCDGDTTVIFVTTWDVQPQQKSIVTIYVDRAGKVTSAWV